MDSFWLLIKQYRQLIIGCLGGSAVPIAGYFLSLSPPWPDGIVALTSVCEMLAVIIAFYYMRRMKLSISNFVFPTFLLSFLILLGLYLFLLSSLTFTVPATPGSIVSERYVRGLTCRDEVRKLFENDCPNLTKQQIAQFEYEPDQIWTRDSIDKARVSIFIVWILAFMNIAFLFAGFAAQQIQLSRQPKR
ncbi:hypothetical protein [Roseibium aggregatum]|uniref:hypothetical protein n=1 Tax=Roseibium aggregatum TaxID=187304 RepID=UPI001A8D3CBE|nr:hypothetical protein [Roseibium aggregatum]MBN8183123.1 hypothetical protein [Roseibium aggregatum]